MPGGRPTLYKPENAEIARIACMLGATNALLAERFEVSRSTIDNWIASIPDFSDAVRKGREVADGAVVSALYARAVGQQHKVTRAFCHDGKPITVDVTVDLPPDVRACMFWLRNRLPQQWREDRPIVDARTEAELLRDLEEADECVRRRRLEEERASALAHEDAVGAV